MRSYDLILFGVTGYTGRLVAEALLESDVEGLRWALAGRTQSKLEAVREQIAQRFPEASNLPLVLADVDDPASVAAMAQSTRVLCTTVGPYVRYGGPVVAACVAAGTDYCDLTGEVGFMRRNIEAYHEAAQAASCRIVHACGFDSVPFDIGVFAAQQEFARRYGRPADRVRSATGRMKGTFSGGTIASMAILMDTLRVDPSARRLLGNPYALVPGDTGPDKNESRAVAYSSLHKQWTTPFIMAGCNTRVVRRSHALLGKPWGADFSYTEVMGTGPGRRGWFRAHGVRLLLVALMTVVGVRWLRRLAVGRLLPSPGEGPSEQERNEGYFEVHVHASGSDPEHREPLAVDLRVVGKGDPGYLATSRMLAQCALALAKDSLPERYGVLTPGSVLGDALLKRLPRVGISFDA